MTLAKGGHLGKISRATLLYPKLLGVGVWRLANSRQKGGP